MYVLSPPNPHVCRVVCVSAKSKWNQKSTEKIIQKPNGKNKCTNFGTYTHTIIYLFHFYQRKRRKSQSRSECCNEEKKRQPLVERIKEWNKGCHTRLRNCEHIERSPSCATPKFKQPTEQQKYESKKTREATAPFFVILPNISQTHFCTAENGKKLSLLFFFARALSLSPSLCCFIIFRFILCLDKAS